MGDFGIDLSGNVSRDQWQTVIAEKSVRFAIIRSYRNIDGGMPDADCPATVKNALHAGLSDIDVYHFPAVAEKSPEAQLQENLGFLKRQKTSFGRLWLDVETEGSWSKTDRAGNVEFIKRFVAAAKAAAVPVGIYTGTDVWREITANTTAFADLPLWWSSHDKVFAPFAGWKKAAIIQGPYDQQTACVSYDADHRPEPGDLEMIA